MMCQGASRPACRQKIIPIILEMSRKPVQKGLESHGDVEGMVAAFLDCFEGEDRREAMELLELARTSYQLRDDDNIHLGRIEDQLNQSLKEAQKRLKETLYRRWAAHGS
jgi:transcriptional regulator of NAD metabolism